MTGTDIEILLVEASATDALLLESELTESSFGTFSLSRVTSLREAFVRLREQRFDVLLLEVGLSDNQGLLALAQIREYDPEIPIVVLTSPSEQLLGIRALEAGAEDYIVKSGSRDILRTIVHAIQRKRTNAARLASERQLALVVEAAGLSIFEWNIGNGTITWFSQQPLLFGLQPEKFPVTLQAFERCVHPEDRPGFDVARRQSVAIRADFLHQYRAIGPNGNVQWLEGRGKVFADDQGIPVRMIGTVMDITLRKAASEVAITRNKESARLSEANLTPRELTLLKLISSGLPSKRIALDLKISIKTVAKHRSHLMAKTKALNAADLARMTTIAGLFAAD